MIEPQICLGIFWGFVAHTIMFFVQRIYQL